MSLPPLPILDFSFLADPPPAFGIGEVWVRLADAGAAGDEGLPAEAPAAPLLPVGTAEPPAVAVEAPPAVTVPEEAPEPAAPGTAAPAGHADADMAPDWDLPPEDAFPTLAELDAILAEHAGPPPVPDAAMRAEVAMMLGLDPAIAEDPALFEAAVAGYTMPEPDPLPEDFTDPAAPCWWWSVVPQDWSLG